MFIRVIIFTLIILANLDKESIAQIEYRKRLFMRNIASSHIDANGKKIITIGIINSRFMGPEVTRFFLAHERAHFALNHHAQLGLKSLQQIEKEADIYAFKTISSKDRLATQKWFTSRPNIKGSPYHGTGYQRANRANFSR